MKSSIFTYVIILMTTVLSSCIDDKCPEEALQASGLQSAKLVTRANEEDLLSFDSKETFLKAVQEISALSSSEEKENWVKDKYREFTSIQNLYWRAMEEMAEIDDVTEEIYSRFEEKYEGLFFPKYQEDMGYYIPLVNLDMGYLVNRNCEVLINGSIVNVRDINGYDELVKLGRAYYSNEEPSMLESLTPIYYSESDLDPVGKEYDSGWSTYKTDKYYKIKLKARRRWKKFSEGPATGIQSIFHLEFCFRKESWLGWANFKSTTTLVFKADIPGFGVFSPVLDEKNGHSSHDWEFTYPMKFGQDNMYRYLTYFDTPCTADVLFKHIGYPVRYTWTMPGAQAQLPLMGNPRLFNFTY